MTPESALTFRNAFREARLKVLANAENYQELLFVLERLTMHLTGESKGLGNDKARSCIMELVRHGALEGRPAASGAGELRASELYDLVRHARNDAMHEGAVARNLAVHLVQLGVMLEDALVNKADDGRKAKHYMMREPITAEPWEPIAFVRQKMLVHSFSHLPVRIDGSWKIVSDHGIAVYLWQSDGGVDVKERLQQRLDCAVKEETLKLRCAVVVKPEAIVSDVVNEKECERYIRQGYPILVGAEIKGEDKKTLLGILTPFDLLYAPRFKAQQT